MQSILLAGAGGHAISCIDVVEQQNNYRIQGIIGLPSELGKKLLGYSVIGDDSCLKDLVTECPNALITIGQIKSFELRASVFRQLKAIGFSMPAIISPHAYVSAHAIIGEGSIVMHGAVVNAGAHVGVNCIINSKSLIEHGAFVGDHCHISTSSVINGDVRVGKGSFLGSRSCIREGIQIPEVSFIKMGELVTRRNTKALMGVDLNTEIL